MRNNSDIDFIIKITENPILKIFLIDCTPIIFKNSVNEIIVNGTVKFFRVSFILKHLPPNSTNLNMTSE